MSSEPGIYIFLDQKNKTLYIGKAKDLKKRVSSYFINKKNLGEKTKALILKTARIKTIVTSSEIEALLLEANYIRKYKPKYNTRLTDGKAYPLIRITIKDLYPCVLIARKADDRRSVYFGPYPSASSMRLVMSTIRKIFPFQSSLSHPKRACLYYHLGLCPCPTVFAKNNAVLTKSYRKDISRIAQFLLGSTKSVIKDLEKERNSHIRKEEFEKAQFTQEKINALNLIANPIYKYYEDNINPNLEVDLRKEELDALLDVLKKNGVNVNSLDRIECFDISNIYGQLAVGSMVVFIKGTRNTSLYRKFRIKLNYKGKPNDFAMIKEVIERRFNHDEWDSPGLIIIDGGKGQVSSVTRALKNKSLDIPVIGLAKREETIVTQRFAKIRLPKSSKTLHLVMRIRDEAHRFAITYHRKLRLKLLVL